MTHFNRHVIWIYFGYVTVFCSVQCNSSEEQKPDKTEAKVCECKDLILDEGYNHFYLNDRKTGYNGKCSSVFYNGQKSLEKNFVDGKVHGKMYEWYDTGQLKSEKEFDMNLQTGEQIDYDANGNVVFHALYKRGKQTEVLVYKKA